MQTNLNDRDRKIRWGILGCGRIAGKFAADLQLVEDASLAAVASRDLAKAKAFASQYPAWHCHGSYEALVTNPEVDVVYVASPHALHAEHTLLCLSHGKAVLCEKPFSMNALQARAMAAMARDRNVFLMEALWTKFMPHYQKLMHMIRSGELGEMKSVLVNFGFATPQPAPERMFNPELGGGSLLDIGIYNVFMAMSALGRPDEVEAWMTPAASGVDEQCAVTFRYQSGAMAQLFSSFASHMATEADFCGTSARVRLAHRFFEPSTSIEYYPGRVETKTILPFEKTPGWGYHYEIRHVQDCLRRGLSESPVMGLHDSIELMEVLDEIRQKAGIRYPSDIS
jgi:predicted dehydrogenase